MKRLWVLTPAFFCWAQLALVAQSAEQAGALPSAPAPGIKLSAQAAMRRARKLRAADDPHAEGSGANGAEEQPAGERQPIAGAGATSGGA